MIKIETEDFVQGSFAPVEGVKRGQVGDFGGKEGVWMADTSADEEGTVAFEADLASGTAGENIQIGQVVYYDRDNFTLYTKPAGSGGEKGANPVGYALHTVDSGSKIHFRFRQKTLK